MRRLTILCCLLLAVAACGGQTLAGERSAPLLVPADDDSGVSAASPPTLAPVPQALRVSARTWEGFTATGPQDVSLAGLTRGEVDVYESPNADKPTRTLPATTILGTATVVTAVSPPTDDGWIEVLVPGRPNGGTGWVPVELLDLYVVTDRIVIDLSERELVYFDNGVEVLRSAIAIGTSHNPTPTGTFFVTDRVRISGGGPWGPAALGLSARSDTITEFNGGDGIIGIHGTNKPGSIGTAASLGCVRLPNDLIEDLHWMVSLGTPVEIQA